MNDKNHKRDRLENPQSSQPGRDWRRGCVRISDLIPNLMDPICSKRGIASSALLGAWPDIIGSTFAEETVPEKIQWPYKRSNGEQSYRGGVLVVRVDGPKAIYLQHEEAQIIQRLNQFFGFSAIERLKVVQTSIQRKRKTESPELPPLTEKQDRQLVEFITEFDDKALNDAVLKMGRGVLRRTLLEKSKPEE